MRFQIMFVLFTSFALGACTQSGTEVTPIARDEDKLHSCIKVCDSLLDGCYAQFTKAGIDTSWCTNDLADSCYQNCWDNYGI